MATEMMQHYLAMKEKYKDCILFYRLGDFYEMFYDDAIKASDLLSLTLTGKNCGEEERAPMCGIPYHAADGYIAKLVSFGEKVAICEQLSDPKLAGRNLVERDVIRIVSAGTVIEDSCLDETKNNYIACLYSLDETSSALSWADITTGEFFAVEYSGNHAIEDAVGQLLKLAPAEIICNEDALLKSRDLKEVRHNLLPPFSPYVPWAFNVKHAEKNLLEQFHTATLAPFSLAGKDSAVSAAGALLEYLKETQKRSLDNLTQIRTEDKSETMVLDSIAVRNLDLIRSGADGKKYGSLLWLLDKTKTGMGARLLTKMILSPLKSVEKINYRLDGVEELFNASVVRMGLSETLHEVKDVERLSGKISNGNFTPKDALALANSLTALPNLKFELTGFSSKILRDIDSNIGDFSRIADLLTRAIDPDASAVMKDGGYIRTGFNAQLDELREIMTSGKDVLTKIEEREKERTGIKTLKVGYNRVFGYYIEVSNSFKDRVPPEYIRKQTLTTGERFITEELKEYEEKILTSGEKALSLESRIFSDILEILSQNIEEFKKVSEAVALLDCIVAFATVAKERKYCRPEIVPSGETLSITEGRHPVVEAIAKEKFVPNDTLLDGDENRSAIITGPNMAGKSTYMRQVALIVLMAHIGSFVPAYSAKIPLTDRIFTRVGASDNLIFDQSTFMVEMTEVATILHYATKDSLLILDEVGRGTSTYDGLSIAWSVIEYLTEKIGAKTLFATHYHELTELENKIDGVKNYKVLVKEQNGTVVFLRKIARGGANRSFGIEVASLAGVQAEITSRAKAILKSLEKRDITKIDFSAVEEEIKEANETQERPLSEVEKILKDTDVNTLSPMQALLFLGDLKEKVEKEK